MANAIQIRITLAEDADPKKRLEAIVEAVEAVLDDKEDVAEYEIYTY